MHAINARLRTQSVCAAHSPVARCVPWQPHARNTYAKTQLIRLRQSHPRTCAQCSYPNATHPPQAAAPAHMRAMRIPKHNPSASGNRTRAHAHNAHHTQTTHPPQATAPAHMRTMRILAAHSAQKHPHRVQAFSISGSSGPQNTSPPSAKPPRPHAQFKPVQFGRTNPRATQ